MWDVLTAGHQVQAIRINSETCDCIQVGHHGMDQFSFEIKEFFFKKKTCQSFNKALTEPMGNDSDIKHTSNYSHWNRGSLNMSIAPFPLESDHLTVPLCWSLSLSRLLPRALLPKPGTWFRSLPAVKKVKEAFTFTLKKKKTYQRALPNTAAPLAHIFVHACVPLLSLPAPCTPSESAPGAWSRF